MPLFTGWKPMAWCGFGLAKNLLGSKETFDRVAFFEQVVGAALGILGL